MLPREFTVSVTVTGQVRLFAWTPFLCYKLPLKSTGDKMEKLLTSLSFLCMPKTWVVLEIALHVYISSTPSSGGAKYYNMYPHFSSLSTAKNSRPLAFCRPMHVATASHWCRYYKIQNCCNHVRKIQWAIWNESWGNQNDIHDPHCSVDCCV